MVASALRRYGGIALALARISSFAEQPGRESMQGTASAGPVRVLICDLDEAARNELRRELKGIGLIADIIDSDSLSTATAMLARGCANVVVIDLFGLGIHESSDFIATIRRKYPQVTFVLWADDEMFLEHAAFFDGARSRLPEYYRMARSLSGAELTQATREAVNHCLVDLGVSMVQSSPD